MSDVLKICSSFACTIAINLVVTRLSCHGDSQVTCWLMLRPRSTRPCPVCHCRSGYSRGLWCGVEILILYTLHTLTYLGYPEPCVGRGSVTYWYDKYTRCAPHYAQTLLQEWVLLHWNASALNVKFRKNIHILKRAKTNQYSITLEIHPREVISCVLFT